MKFILLVLLYGKYNFNFECSDSAILLVAKENGIVLKD